MHALQEFLYRRMFGLSKGEMAEEPMEDVLINFKLNELLTKKEHLDRVIVEEKAKRSGK